MSPSRVYLLIAFAAVAFGVHVALQPPPVPVLLLHDVNPQRAAHDFWTLHPKRFGELLDLLDRTGYRGIRLDEARAQIFGSLPRERAREAVLITVDDGCASSATLIGPELKRRGHAGTFFVVTGWGAPAHLTEADVKALQAAGHDVGSHSVTHASLASRERSDRETARIERELVDSQARLIQWLHADVKGFAYPRGEFDALTKALAQSAGYQLAFTTDTGYLTPGADPMELPRYQLNWDTPLDWVEEYLTAPRRERTRRLLLLAGVALLSALGAAVAELNRRRSAPSCHTDRANATPEEMP